MPADLLDLSQAVERSGRSLPTLYRRIHDGSLPAFRDGSKYKVRPSDLDTVFAPRPVIPRDSDERDQSIVEAVERALCATPPLSAERRAELSSLLSSGGDTG